MRSTILVLAAALAAMGTAAAAGPLAEGRYGGTGTWAGPDGAGGTYRVEAEVAGNALSFRWSWEQGGGRTENIALRFVPAEGGGYSLLDAKDAVIGTARCLEGQCLLRMDTGPVQVVQTVASRSGRLESFGVKSGPGFTVTYTESLTAR